MTSSASATPHAAAARAGGPPAARGRSGRSRRRAADRRRARAPGAETHRRAVNGGAELASRRGGRTRSDRADEHRHAGQRPRQHQRFVAGMLRRRRARAAPSETTVTPRVGGRRVRTRARGSPAARRARASSRARCATIGRLAAAADAQVADADHRARRAGDARDGSRAYHAAATTPRRRTPAGCSSVQDHMQPDRKGAHDAAGARRREQLGDDGERLVLRAAIRLDQRPRRRAEAARGAPDRSTRLTQRLARARARTGPAPRRRWRRNVSAISLKFCMCGPNTIGLPKIAGSRMLWPP